MRSETFNTNAKIANDLKTKRVAELNDKLREMIFKDVKAINKELKSWLYAQPIKDKIVITPGINALTNQQQLYIFNRVKTKHCSLRHCLILIANNDTICWNHSKKTKRIIKRQLRKTFRYGNG